jgi:hypothetical protein
MRNYNRNMGKVMRDETRFKSMLEQLVAASLKDKATYETVKFSYVVPASKHTYTPDFCLSPTKFIEAKGIWDAEDRRKMLLVIKQYPEVKFYMLFQNARKKIAKGSKTSYGDWCDKHNIEYGHFPSGIPAHWLT